MMLYQRLTSCPLIAFALLASLPFSIASNAVDSARLGSYYTSIPVYRTGGGNNVVSVGIGTPPQDMNLTLSTNVDYIMVVTSDCDDCLNAATSFISNDSSSLTTSTTAIDYEFPYPAASDDSLELIGDYSTEIITDPRQDTENAHPMVLVYSVALGSSTAGSTNTELSAGSSGFWGLGVDQSSLEYSIIPAMISVTGEDAPTNATSFTVGFDISNYTDQPSSDAGTVHWGAVPDDAYVGDFDWLLVNTTVGGSWGIGLDSLRVGGVVVTATNYYASLDPSFDPIYMPTALAEKLFSGVTGASRDLVDTTRWNLPCDSVISMTVAISGKSYAVDSSTLVSARDVAGVTCWSNIVAWSNGSLPESLGEIRLGTSFLSGVYVALYYSPGEQLVGIAGKPGSVNDFDVGPSYPGHANAKLAGILIGCLLAALTVILILCYARNRSSFQSVWYRSIRRQQRAQLSMMARAQTLPPVPPLMPMPMPMPMAPPPMPMSVTPYGRYPTGGPYHPVTTTAAWQQPAPAYRAPMAPSGVPQLSQNPHALATITSLPAVIEPGQQGVYSPRTLNPPCVTPSAMTRFPARSSQNSSNRWSAPTRGVHWGAVGSRHAQSSSTLSSRQGSSSSRGPPLEIDAPDGESSIPPGHPTWPNRSRQDRYEDWARRYSAPPNVPTQPATVPLKSPHLLPIPSRDDIGRLSSRYGGDLGRMPGIKRPWNWKPRGSTHAVSEGGTSGKRSVSLDEPDAPSSAKSWFRRKTSSSVFSGKEKERLWESQRMTGPRV